MTPDPEADAALDIFEPNWRHCEPSEIADMRSRMRRVLDAHDAGKKPEVLIRENSNTLPMDALPEGAKVWNLSQEDDGEWRFRFFQKDSRDGVMGAGPTPRAAMLAAIEAAKEGK